MRRRQRGTFQRGERWYGDFRAYTDVGGRREPLHAPGVALATMDATEASILYARRIEHYEHLRHHKVTTGLAEVTSLEPYAKHHLEGLTTEGRIRGSTVERYADALANVIERLGAGIQLTEITPQRLTQYIGRRRHDGAAAQTMRHELVALSRMFKRAVSEGRALTNPVALLHDKPRVVRGEAVWLTIDEGARLLDAAKKYDALPKRAGTPIGFLRPLLATFLLTGGRKQEVFALRRADLDWENDVVRIRPYEGHTLKRGDGRAVPFWLQLQDILRDYLRTAPAHISGLLFSSPTPHVRRGAQHWRLVDVREALDWVLKEAEIEKHVSLHTLRHTYCATRLQTYHYGPNGQAIQVGVFQVACELGHRGGAMVEQVYAHVSPRPDRLQPEVRYTRKQKEKGATEPQVVVSVS